MYSSVLASWPSAVRLVPGLSATPHSARRWFLIVYNMAIKILTVSIVFASSALDRIFSPDVGARSAVDESLESLEVLGSKESVDTTAWRPGKVGAGTRTRI